MKSIFSIIVALPVLVTASGRADGQLSDRLAQSPSQQSPKLQQVEWYQRDLERLGKEVAATQGGDDKDRLQKQVELQQKQIQTLEQMIRLLTEQVRKAPPAGTALDQLQDTMANLEARAQHAARRDQEIANVHNDLLEHVDAAERNGPELPSTLRELFLPSRTNESPVAIYGTLAGNFTNFEDAPSNFPAAVFSPHFYLFLNEQFLLEANPEFSGQNVELESAQLDWFLNDHLTLVVGRFYSPIGFFNERMHTSWIYKTPDRPLMFSQVLPASLSFNGLMLKGATYLCDWPVKLEFASFVTNGFSLAANQPTAKDFADLRSMSDGFNDVNEPKAYGGRVGLTFPTLGIMTGVSGLVNGSYDRASRFDLNLWDADFSWHMGNWDVKFEFAQVWQDAPIVPIRRKGLYGQVAYRPYDSEHTLLQITEALVRFDMVRFEGIDLNATGLDFGARENVPVDRNRYTVGVNFYPYATLIIKFAYEINEELHFRSLDDNGFLAQVAWGW